VLLLVDPAIENLHITNQKLHLFRQTDVFPDDSYRHKKACPGYITVKEKNERVLYDMQMKIQT
jgi:hypothetical protein